MLIKLYAITKEKEKAKKIADKFSTIEPDILFLYYIEFEEYETACDLIEEYWIKHKREISTLISYSYAKLKLKRYKDVYWELNNITTIPKPAYPHLPLITLLQISNIINSMKRK